jgi:hypothetical protein
VIFRRLIFWAAVLLGDQVADDSNWYAKLAKAGWLGTKAQVSAQYGKPDWGSDTAQDSTAQAIKNVAKKTPQDASSGS